MVSEPLVYKPAEAGERLRVSRSKAYELIASGEIPSVRIGGCVRVPVKALEDYVARKRREAEESV